MREIYVERLPTGNRRLLRLALMAYALVGAFVLLAIGSALVSGASFDPGWLAGILFAGVGGLMALPTVLAGRHPSSRFSISKNGFVPTNYGHAGDVGKTIPFSEIEHVELFTQRQRAPEPPLFGVRIRTHRFGTCRINAKRIYPMLPTMEARQDAYAAVAEFVGFAGGIVRA